MSRNFLEQALDKVIEADEKKDQLTAQANKNRDTIESIRGRMNSGAITYAQAEAEAKPVIDAMNKRIEEIAKEYGKKPKYLSFKYLMR